MFGYRLSFETPKTQHLFVNDMPLPDVVFDSVTCTWFKKKLSIPLKQGSNVLKMNLRDGWMDLDYLDCPNKCTVSVADHSELPVSFSLQQNHPNPFNPSTEIRFSLPRHVHVTLKVFDVNGREVATLVDGEMTTGNHAVTFSPSHTASGLYFYKLTAGKFSQTRKAVLLR